VPLYVCTALFALVAAAVLYSRHIAFPFESGLFFIGAFAEFLLVMLLFLALRQLFLIYRQERPEHPLGALYQRMIGVSLEGDRIGNLLHGSIACTLIVMLFTALKVEIANLSPFAWDAAFMRADRAIGFGVPYWQLLQPVLGHPLFTIILSFAYAAWFVVMFSCLFWQLSRPRSDALRSQFLLAFAIAWFVGGFLLATVFSSAGPCFYSHVVQGPDPYAPLMQYLRHTKEHWPVWTIGAQDMLWRAYLTGQGEVEGISAMPSLHITIATLLAFLGWRTSRYLGIAFTAFAVTIFLGSIMLAWHYSVDGIAGAALAAVFWMLAGKITNAWSAYCARPARLGPLPGAPVLE
jgi:hypothetical protein